MDFVLKNKTQRGIFSLRSKVHNSPAQPLDSNFASKLIHRAISSGSYVFPSCISKTFESKQAQTVLVKFENATGI